MNSVWVTLPRESLEEHQRNNDTRSSLTSSRPGIDTLNSIDDFQAWPHLRQREAFEMPRLRRRAEREYERDLEMVEAFKVFCIEKAQADAKAAKPVKKKAPDRPSRPAAQSSSIKVNPGPRPNKDSRPESTQPSIVEHVEFSQPSQHPSHSPADHANNPLISSGEN